MGLGEDAARIIAQRDEEKRTALQRIQVENGERKAELELILTPLSQQFATGAPGPGPWIMKVPFNRETYSDGYDGSGWVSVVISGDGRWRMDGFDAGYVRGPVVESVVREFLTHELVRLLS